MNPPHSIEPLLQLHCKPERGTPALYRDDPAIEIFILLLDEQVFISQQAYFPFLVSSVSRPSRHDISRRWFCDAEYQSQGNQRRN